MGGSSAHQKAILGNLVASLIAAESLVTTEARAKALRPVAERRASKSGATASARRTTTSGASWRLRARASPAPSKGTAGRSTWTTWPRACTPASVRPAQVITGASLRRAVRSIAWRSAPATVGTSGWAAKPRKAAPS